jgi:hypothetical protein
MAVFFEPRNSPLKDVRHMLRDAPFLGNIINLNLRVSQQPKSDARTPWEWCLEAAGYCPNLATDAEGGPTDQPQLDTTHKLGFHGHLMKNICGLESEILEH